MNSSDVAAQKTTQQSARRTAETGAEAEAGARKQRPTVDEDVAAEELVLLADARNEADARAGEPCNSRVMRWTHENTESKRRNGSLDSRRLVVEGACLARETVVSK